MASKLNIAALIDGHAASRPNHPAILWRDEVITYDAFAKSVRQHANQLAAQGIQQGDLVGLCLDDTPEYLEILCALARIGAVTLPMDIRWMPAEVERLANHFRPSLILTGRDLTGLVGDAKLSMIDETWRAQVATCHSETAPIAEDENLPLLISLSSGTTGRPTGPMLRHNQMFARVVSQMASLGFSSYDRFMTATPLYFGGGRSFSLAQLMLGATLVLHCPPYKMEDLCEAVRRYKVSSTFLVPTMLRRLLELDDSALSAFGGLRQLISSGAPLHQHERLAVRQRITPNYYEYYASTEGGGISVLSPEGQDGHPDSVGTRLFRVEVQVVDDNHTPLPNGQIGAVRYRGPGVAESFFRDEEASRAAFKDGWFYPGDLGEFSAGGYLSLRGRKKDMILRAGINIYPLELEQIVSQITSIQELCIFPLPHPDLGEEVAIAYVPAEGHAPADIQAEIVAHCRKSLAPYKIPTKFFPLDALPRNSGGKVVRALVLETVQAIG